MVSVVIDTNTFMEILSVADILSPYEKVFRGEATELDIKEVDYRINRVGESVLLAQVFHRTKTSSYNLVGESLRVLTRMVPPIPKAEESDHTSVSRYHTMKMIHFVKDYVWPNWTWVNNEVETVTSNACDELLVQKALEYKVPLISREFPTKKGSIFVRAANAGVEAMSPGEYLRRSGLNIGHEAFRFLTSFQLKAPKYLSTLTQKDPGLRQLNEMLRVFSRMFGPMIDAA